MTKNKHYFQGIILLLCTFFAVAAQAANQLESVRIWAAPESTRIVFDLSEVPNYSYFTLDGPNRLVVDLKKASTKLNLKNVDNNSKLVKGIRVSKSPTKGDLRLVIDLVKPLNPNLFSLPVTAPYGNRLVVDLEDKSATAELSAVSSTPVKKNVTQSVQASRDIVIAIDAGHGGDDPGSIGPSGLYEKKVVFEISKRLASKINDTPGMRAVMIRSGDYFVNLNRRSELARNSKADLLISIHADAFTSPNPRGASVWVLSMRRANSEIGRWLEQKEKHSELLGGAGEIIQNTDNEQYLAMTLLDMSMNSSMAIGHSVAGDILKDLGAVTELHKSRPESASFAVLKSPDIPSILVETGFISNPKEERLLSSSRHQESIATAIYKGVNRYFHNNPPADTLLAKKNTTGSTVKSSSKSAGTIKHKVSRGESLSAIAQRYKVPMASIIRANGMKTDVVQLGQTLVIPES
ncbi:N-acetylmuramoyl-L-alanine amidase [Shewanella oneidensis MR-1]|uniref:N-acetylmuramoyl-L-alanine amidase AmiC n=1 Tax=Shewanella oneidensis (strain ATCC 700550 / JCM 31522 / CIP 106686 / LMG 19005 / NCIMB 14063 / MR-1) TaxID=211586 RepID=Q8EJ71_SHEON|nr:N-acetylmuramoyl-L-alanine amidase [Shewanella oneidensis]AAN53678.1 N-acetylmuramoyl-L-alanine amidase AmiB [Shewanella oneidensis MR-1]MDX5997472.1 N-acetylmuramoyl-L-alanine amidase [Shewanella oneidensis]MEE2027959.1 N-acetylmuramoyl-L-alanine amidase AmiB [Shewanella oneidensis]QKG95494.1 N-acetylmuramoyl-L-alanine amidase [Shewanella oneidensis MR-1]